MEGYLSCSEDKVGDNIQDDDVALSVVNLLIYIIEEARDTFNQTSIDIGHSLNSTYNYINSKILDISYTNSHISSYKYLNSKEDQSVKKSSYCKDEDFIDKFVNVNL